MPLLHGEGNKAFVRLQQMIISDNSDLSIFGWSPEEDPISIRYLSSPSSGCRVDCGHRDDNEDHRYSILASSPTHFSVPRNWEIFNSLEHFVTSRGIRIYCSLFETCLGGCDFSVCRCCPDARKYVLAIGDAKGDETWGIVLDKLAPDMFMRSNKRLLREDASSCFKLRW